MKWLGVILLVTAVSCSGCAIVRNIDQYEKIDEQAAQITKLEEQLKAKEKEVRDLGIDKAALVVEVNNLREQLKVLSVKVIEMPTFEMKFSTTEPEKVPDNKEEEAQ